MKNDTDPHLRDELHTFKSHPGKRKGALIKLLCIAAMLAAWIASGRLEAGAAESSGTAEAGNTQTAGSGKTDASAKEKSGRWVKKNGYYYYYLGKKKAVGYIEIKGKYYLFDSAGRQMTGWRQVGKNVRYFRIKNGAKGYMVTGKKINGVKLDKKGVAKSNSDVSLKISLMLRYQKLADRLVKPATPQEKKLYQVFMYARGRSFRETGNAPHTRHWDQEHARDFIMLGSVDCVMAACGFAYLANAIGYRNIVVRLYGHGHCEIGDLCYDPTCARTLPVSEYRNWYGISKSKAEAEGLWINRADHRKI